MEGKLYTGEDYKKEFDSQDYLKTYYTFDSGTIAEHEILKFNLKNLFETFSSGECLVSISGRDRAAPDRKSCRRQGTCPLGHCSPRMLQRQLSL